MINLEILFGILVIHWIADFIVQTDEQAKGKSTSWKYLVAHVTTYTLCWIFPLMIYGILMNLTHKILFFLPITFICHIATDYYTSRVNSQLFKEGNIHGFFVSVGFDQLLHYFQLILTLNYLI